MQWQPIETAPKDGSVILVFDPTPIHGMIEISSGTYAKSEETYPRGIYLSYWSKGDSLNKPNWSDGCLNGFPSHWMSLPEPPHGR